MLGGLAFLPINEVVAGYTLIKAHFPSDEKSQEFMKYFEDTYVLGKVRVQGRRAPPIFPPAVWSVHEQTGKF